MLLGRLAVAACCWLTFGDLFGSRQAANKALKREVGRGFAEVVGSVNLHGDGGNCLVYAGPDAFYRRNQLRHDVLSGRVMFRLGLPFLLGPDVCQKRLPDFEAYADGGVRLYVELDSGASPYGRIADERYPKYDDCSDPVVWVSCGLWGTDDKTRMAGLLARAGGRKGMWFTTFRDVMAAGLRATAMNCDGDVRTVTRLATGLDLASPTPSPEE